MSKPTRGSIAWLENQHKQPPYEYERIDALTGQLTIVCAWLEAHAHQYCKCENNGDYCEFHEMLAQAKEALK